MHPVRLCLYGLRFPLIVTMVLVLLIPASVHAQEPLPCGFARISGVVTGNNNGTPLEDVSVYVYGDLSFLSTTTDSSGAYSIGVPAFKDPGPFVVDATDFGGQYLPNRVVVSSQVMIGRFDLFLPLLSVPDNQP